MHHPILTRSLHACRQIYVLQGPATLSGHVSRVDGVPYSPHLFPCVQTELYVAGFKDQQPYLALQVGFMASHNHHIFSMHADRTVCRSLQGPATLSGHVARAYGPPQNGCGGVGLSDVFHVAHGAIRKAEQCDLQPCSAACYQCTCGCVVCKCPPPPSTSPHP